MHMEIQSAHMAFTAVASLFETSPEGLEPDNDVLSDGSDSPRPPCQSLNDITAEPPSIKSTKNVNATAALRPGAGHV